MNIFGDIRFGNIRNEATSKTYSGGDVHILPTKKCLYICRNCFR